MAKLTQKEFRILVKALGLEGTIDKLGTLNKKTKDTNKSVGQLDRNMKGAAQATSNTTKAFAKQSQGMGGLVHVYATVAANVFALSSAFLVLRNNANLTIMKEAAKDLSKSTGINFATVAENLQKATNGVISFSEALQAANLGLSGGATAEQLTGIADAATKAANAIGRSVPEAVTRMIQAVTKAEPELVDEFGIILRVGKAAEEYAKKHKKAVKDLTTFEKQQSIINQLLDQAEKKFGDAEKRKNPYDSLAASFKNLSEAVISFVSGPIGKFAQFLADNLTALSILSAIMISSIAKRAFPLLQEGFTNFTKGARESARAASKSYKKMQADIIKVSKISKASMQSNLLDVEESLRSSFSKTRGAFIKHNKELESLLKQKGLSPEKFASRFTSIFSRFGKGGIQELNKFLSAHKKASGGLIVTYNGVSTKLLELRNISEEYYNATRKGQAAYSKEFIQGSSIITRSIATIQKAYLSATATFKRYQRSILLGFNVGLQRGFVRGVAGTFKKAYAGALAETNIFAASLKGIISSIPAAIGATVGIIGKFGGGLINLVAFVTALYQSVKIAAQWLGLWNKQLSEAIIKMDEFNKKLNELKDTAISLKNIKFTNFEEQVTNINARFNNLTDVVTGFKEEVLDLSKSLIIDAGISTAWESLLVSFGKTSGVEKFRESVLNTIEALKIATDKDIQINIDTSLLASVSENYEKVSKDTVKFRSIDSKTLHTILQDEETRLKLVGMLSSEMKAITEEAKRTTLAAKELQSGVEELNKEINAQVTKFEQSSPYFTRVEAIKKVINGYEKLKDAGQDTSVILSEMSTETKSLLGISENTNTSKAIKTIRQELEKYNKLVLESSTLTAKLTLEKIKLDGANNNISSGDISYIKEAETIQKRILDLEILSLKASKDKLDLDAKALINSNKKKVVEIQANLIQEQLNAKIESRNKLFYKGNTQLKETTALLKQQKAEFDLIIQEKERGLKVTDKALSLENITPQQRINLLDIKIEKEKEASRIRLLKYENTIVSLKKVEATLSEEVRNGANHTNILLKVRQSLSSEYNNKLTEELELQSRLIQLEKDRQEVRVQEAKYSDEDFYNVALAELKRQHREFRKTMQSDAKTVVKLMVEPISAAMKTLTDGIIEGTKTAKEIMRDVMKTTFESIRDIIMKNLLDRFKESIFQLAVSAFPSLATLLGSAQTPLIASNASLEASILHLSNVISSSASVPSTSISSGGSGAGGIFGTIVKGAIGYFTGGWAGAASSIAGSGYSGSFGSSSMSYQAQPQTFAKGGITNGVSIAGEAGPEAVVPLPDGRQIPVKMENNTGMSAPIITINIDMAQDTSDTNSSNDASGNSAQFATIISQAIKREIVEQQRPGGLLRR